MKKVSILFVFALLMALMTACSGGGGATPGASGNSGNTGNSAETAKKEAPKEQPKSDEKFVLKVSMSNANGTHQHEFTQWMSEELSKRSDGRLSLEIFPGAMLTPADQEIPGMLNGQIDMALSQNGFISAIEQSYSIFEMPFLWDSDPNDPSVFYGKVNAFLNHENGGQLLAKKMEDRGIKVIGNSFESPSAIAVKKDENTITDVSSASGLKIRTPGGKFVPKVVESIGASGVTIATAEVVPALEQGVIDGVVSSIQYIYAGKYPIEAVTVIPVSNWVNPLLISVNKFNSIPSDLQEILVQTGKDFTQHSLEEMTKRGVTLIGDYEKAGIQMNFPTPEQSEQFRETVLPVWDEFTKTVSDGQTLLDAALEANK